MNKQNTEQLKKEFRKRYVSDFMVDDGNNKLLWRDKAPTPNEVWDFFLPHLISSDEIKREALNDFHEKFWKWGISHMPTMYFNHICNFLNDYIDETLTQSKEGGERVN